MTRRFLVCILVLSSAGSASAGPLDWCFRQIVNLALSGRDSAIAINADSFAALASDDELALVWGVAGNTTQQLVVADWYTERGLSRIGQSLRFAVDRNQYPLSSGMLGARDRVQQLLQLEWTKTRYSGFVGQLGASLAYRYPPPLFPAAAFPTVRVDSATWLKNQAGFKLLPCLQLHFTREPLVTFIASLWDDEEFANVRTSLVELTIEGSGYDSVAQLLRGFPHPVQPASIDDLASRERIFYKAHATGKRTFFADAGVHTYPLAERKRLEWLRFLRQLITADFPHFKRLTWEHQSYGREQLAAALAP